MALGALSPDGLVGEINILGRGCSLTRWVGGRVSTNKVMRPWVLSHQMGWWESKFINGVSPTNPSGKGAFTKEIDNS